MNITDHDPRLIDVAVVDLSIDGSAVGHDDGGKVVFLDGGLPGERVRARVIERKKRYDRARVVEVIAKSPERTGASCCHFDICGGCAWQDLEYGAQLRFKRKQVIDALTRLGGFAEITVEDPIPAPKQFYYRNKMEFSFNVGSDSPASLNLGLHHKGEFAKIFDVEECLLQSPVSNAIVQFVREYTRTNKIPAYDVRNHNGYLRFVVIREGKLTGELMVHVITASGDFPDISGFVTNLRAVAPEITTIVHSKTDTRSNIAYAESSETLFGAGYIHERILGKVFRINPGSFFQTNSEQTERLYTIALERAELRAGDTALDLYCGAGTIGICAADRVAQVIGVESEPSAIEAAWINARENNAHNVRFISGDVRKTLREQKKEFGRIDVVIVDPPRAGMHPRAVFHMSTLGARRIVYVSCNPSTFARDAALLCREGYRLGTVSPVDMFPHTAHIELVATFDQAIA